VLSSSARVSRIQKHCRHRVHETRRHLIVVMDFVLVPQFTKRDLNSNPTRKDLETAYEALVSHFQGHDCAFKIVGGYAVF
jgi:hypothetical protein